MQVVDARDPLTYYSEDLERYALELHPTKRSLLLLNKADLLPAALRTAWADHFDGLHLDYAFWSAKAGMDEHSSGGWLRGTCAESVHVSLLQQAPAGCHLCGYIPCVPLAFNASVACR